MEINFASAVVAVTAGGSGFGRSIAQNFARLGARVHACDISEKGISETALTRGVTPAVLDMTDRSAVADWVARTEDLEGRAIDILVNNAGGTLGNRGSPIEDVPDQQWDSIFAINVSSAFAMCRAVAPKMKKQGNGCIINIGSTAGLRPSQTGLQAYTSTKHAVIGLTRQLSRELGPFGIRVNCIAPGRIPNTPAKLASWAQVPGERRDQILERISLRRLGSDEDVANSAIFLASHLSAFITGQVLVVDGGEW